MGLMIAAADFGASRSPHDPLAARHQCSATADTGPAFGFTTAALSLHDTFSHPFRSLPRHLDAATLGQLSQSSCSEGLHSFHLPVCSEHALSNREGFYALYDTSLQSLDQVRLQDGQSGEL